MFCNGIIDENAVLSIASQQAAGLTPYQDLEYKRGLRLTRADRTPWISLQLPNPSASMRLFCFPYAGGGAAIYRDWHKSFPQTIEVCPVQLPGRGERMKDPPFTQIRPLVEATAEALLPFLDKPFAFFGHSMGALISYEIAHLLRREKTAAPAHLFVAAHSAPRLGNSGVITYNLPYVEFIEELRRLNGTPQQVLDHTELMKLMAPLLRADLEICETYPGSKEPLLESPITAFGGINDVKVPRERMELWRENTRDSFSLHMLPGDHFFIHTAQPEIIRLILREMVLE